MKGATRVRKDTGIRKRESKADLSPIFYCPLCPGPVYTPYMEHYFKFHPDFPEVRITRLPDSKSNGAVTRPPLHGTNKEQLTSLDNGGKRAIMAKFQKAKSEQAYFKVALYGKTGSGKTLTSLLWAEGLAAREGKRVAYIDTERGTEFYSLDIPERTVHPKAFDFDRLITRSLMETLEAVESIDPKTYGVLVTDRIPHLWEAARAAYNGKMLPNGGIPIQAWQQIKKPYKRLMSLFLDGSFHAILCGREGVVMEQDEDGEMRVTGTKLKAEGETPHEPHVLGRMCPERDDKGGYIIKAFFEKDRSGILTGKEFLWPTYETIAPVVRYLCGGEQGKLGTPEEAAEIDISAQEAEKEKAERERKDLFDSIRAALRGAKTIDQLQTAWSLTNGKKTRLGDEFFTQLLTIKDSRKAEFLEVA